MPGRAGVILAAAALALGAGAAAADGAGSGWLWDPRAAPPATPREGQLTAAGRASMGPCELDGASRARTPSIRCMACHDGSAGATVSFQMSADGRGMSHPVEVDYGAAVARDPAHYHPQATLPREVPLVNGKVACTSCHDGASPDPTRVAMVPHLCASCHAE